MNRDHGSCHDLLTTH
jgi:hypothetical protein